ncbi:hypothetical protein [Methylobacterium sp. J-070]|uniref:hypothetical protein n=1 Tax=Methylobacterium sp. J-070 TaxID=2836650 RepID=UPI001FBB5A7E|nr:hypothetical protein [Methylobacterium sp. J-070]MCJ2052328.1 hypothetical protein [Methylobacterium sp. J-070]
MIPAADAWGPFRPDLEEVERTARLRCLRAVVHLPTGSRGQIFANLLLCAEGHPAALEPALHALDHLAGLDSPHVLASFAAELSGA